MSRVEGDVLVVDADLMALARIRESAQRVGREVKTASRATLPENIDGIVVFVLDLDRGGVELVDAVAALQPSRVLAFYSHIQADLGRASSEAGFETYPRGKFWNSLDALLS
jgi:hypothetical protein